MTDAPRLLWESIFDAMPPPPSLKVSEWAEKYRFLSPERTNEHGKYRCDRIPMQREPMDSVCDETVSETVLWWASQTAGKTEVLFNIAGFFMHADPATQLYVLPNVELCEEYSRDGLAPMIRDCPALRKLVADPRSRDSGNTIMGKRYPGGSFVYAGANAPAGLAGRPRRVVLKDEIDRYPLSAGTEGDPCALADKRAETYGVGAVKVSTSTATVKGLSRIEAKYEISDKQNWFVKCPKCQHEFVLKFFDHVRWAEGEPENAWLECSTCHGKLTDADRVAMVRSGRWLATAPFRGVRGYWLNGLVILFPALKGFKNRLHQFAAEFLEAKSGGKETMKAWINTFLAETSEEDGEHIDADDVSARAEDYAPDRLPAGVLLLTASGDVHGDRIEYEIKGWGVEEESWGVRAGVIYGDTEKNEVWEAFDKVLLGEFQRIDGLTLKIERAFVDMGHKDKRVLTFCAPRIGRGIFPCRGINRPGLNTPPLLPAKPSRNNKARIPHWNIGVTVAKTAIYDRVMLPAGEARSMHFPKGHGYTADYFKQLTSEKRITKYQFGQKYFLFEKANNAVRNEALDLNVYALAALHSLAPIEWTKLAENLKKRALLQEKTRAAQMVADVMKRPSGVVESVKPSEHTAESPTDKATPDQTAEMDATTGRITPAATPEPVAAHPEPSPAPVRPTPAHWRKANGNRRGGFSRW